MRENAKIGYTHYHTRRDSDTVLSIVLLSCHDQSIAWRYCFADNCIKIIGDHDCSVGSREREIAHRFPTIARCEYHSERWKSVRGDL